MKTEIVSGLVFIVTFNLDHYCFRFKTFLSDFELIEKNVGSS